MWEISLINNLIVCWWLGVGGVGGGGGMVI